MDKVFSNDQKEEILELLGKMKPEEISSLIGKIRQA